MFQSAGVSRHAHWACGKAYENIISFSTTFSSPYPFYLRTVFTMRSNFPLLKEKRKKRERNKGRWIEKGRKVKILLII